MQLMSGIAGHRGRNPSGVVIHNDAASQGATTAYYRNWLPSHNAELGFAHWYVCSDGILQVENEANKAWHTANANGNANYIGIEACQSMGNLATFQDNEARSIKLAAEILKRYGLQPNRNTVILHKQFSATACPHRSVTLHGDWTIMQDYFINQIRKYMNGNSSTETPKEDTNNNIKLGEIGMFIYYNRVGKRVDQIGVWGNKRFHLDTKEKVQHFSAMVKNFTGKEVKVYRDWAERSEQIRTVESFTEVQKTVTK